MEKNKRILKMLEFLQGASCGGKEKTDPVTTGSVKMIDGKRLGYS